MIRLTGSDGGFTAFAGFQQCLDRGHYVVATRPSGLMTALALRLKDRTNLVVVTDRLIRFGFTDSGLVCGESQGGSAETADRSERQESTKQRHSVPPIGMRKESGRGEADHSRTVTSQGTDQLLPLTLVCPTFTGALCVDFRIETDPERTIHSRSANSIGNGR